ncbi:hypothetical protein AAFG07_34270 [Bradyrhizobium sp. B097]|uniref:hypothetical protein n=1 Tax=Bradyrhizobium sp. B097 TaxID=3140244 RepID=UPI003183CAFB
MVDADNMILDPENSDNWIRNSDGEWQRKGAAARYRSKVDDNERRDPEMEESSLSCEYEDNFM